MCEQTIMDSMQSIRESLLQINTQELRKLSEHYPALLLGVTEHITHAQDTVDTALLLMDLSPYDRTLETGTAVNATLITLGEVLLTFMPLVAKNEGIIETAVFYERYRTQNARAAAMSTNIRDEYTRVLPQFPD